MPIPAELDRLLADRCMIKKKLADIDKQLRTFWKDMGTINHRGLVVCKTQSIMQNFPLPAACAAKLPELVDFQAQPREIENYLTITAQGVATRSWRKVLRQWPVGAILLESLGDEGLVTLYGKASSINVLGRMPKEGSCVILEPGDKPLVSDYNPPADEEEAEE